MALGMAHGGWCPRGRLAEDGVVPSRYELEENDSRDYTVRTEQNVLDSDATLIVYEGRLKGGTLLTRRLAQRLRRPYLLVRIDKPWSAPTVWKWFDECCPRTLNVAGPRESTSPGIYERALQALLRILERPSLNHSGQTSGSVEQP
ncbi:Putative molybdenum carrier [Roseimaritima ulvae]|uniref:Molybdenum carrier n=2 Tax=Roseimaritima ulvae TaxID=980254 RepID=A0A5B9QNQ6_9BACT|nr:Putative molybdenum carrier [Roseimaritima ulvae]